MPLFRCNDKLVFFAHIPKCGGQSVEAYLAKRFGSLAFLDNKHRRLESHLRWGATSPQHIEMDALRRLFPSDWFYASFAVVRNPYTRLVSAWNFRLMTRKTHELSSSIEDWLNTVAGGSIIARHESDNHLARQVDLVPDDAKTFQLEEGMNKIVSWLDELEGKQHSERQIPKSNTQGKPLTGLKKSELSQDAIDAIREIYADDFSKFGYSDQPPSSKLWVYEPTGKVRVIRSQRNKRGFLSLMLPKHRIKIRR